MSWTTAAIWVAAIASGAFTLLYGFKSEWYKHPVGRMQFAKSASLSLILWLSLAGRVLGDYPGRVVIGVVVLWIVAITLVTQVVVLLLAQAGKLDTRAFARKDKDRATSH
jgi:hypothetical protein